MVKQLATLAEFEEVIKGDKLVVIDFTASWCPPCQMIKPKFEELSMKAEYSDVIFTKIDVDENEAASEKCGITCMPTFQYWKSGKMVDKVEGADIKQVEALINKNK